MTESREARTQHGQLEFACEEFVRALRVGK